MSQFCGSFWALSRRSRLTVSLYCACGCEVESVASETPARIAQDNRTRARVLWGMRFFSLEGRLLFGRSMALSDRQLYLRTSGPTMGACAAAPPPWLLPCCQSPGDTYLLPICRRPFAVRR